MTWNFRDCQLEWVSPENPIWYRWLPLPPQRDSSMGRRWVPCGFISMSR